MAQAYVGSDNIYMAATFVDHSLTEAEIAHAAMDFEWQELLAAPAVHFQLPSVEISESDDCMPASPRTREAMEQFFDPSHSPVQHALDSLTAHTPEPSAEETTDKQGHSYNGEVEGLIWHMTSEYVRMLQSVCSGPQCPSTQELASRLTQRFAAENKIQCRVAVHALCIASALRAKGANQFAVDSESGLGREESASNELDGLMRLEALASADCFRIAKKAKTGRKPEDSGCFLCPAVFPYKKDLVRHFQKDHGITRSQSLLYKRLKQGSEYFKQLYVEKTSE